MAVVVDGNLSDFTVSRKCAGVELTTGAHCWFGVRFTPTSPGEKAVTVRITPTSPASSWTARVTGTAR